MSKEYCKGKCGQLAEYKGWCKVKWTSGNKFAVDCPIIERKRGKSISIARIEESKIGKNPMQNPVICAKNHSERRNKKCSEVLKEKGKLGILPQQTENKELREERRKNISISLKRLFSEGNHPRQRESTEKRKQRMNKMANSLRILGKEGKLPIQNMTKEQKERLSRKISEKLREGLMSGRIKLSKSWKKVPYKDLILRSEWERIMADFLDRNGFVWEYETKRIPYFDSERKIEAVTIPDFYIPSLNLIIEVKSNGEFNSQKTREKLNGIRERGFNAILAGRKEISLIKENKFLTFLRGAIK